MIAFTVNRSLPQNNIYEEKNDDKQRICKCYIIGDFSKIHYFLVSSLRILARTKETIPKIPLNVNANTSVISLIGAICGSMNIIPNQPAAIFTKNSDNISSQLLPSLDIISAYVSQD